MSELKPSIVQNAKRNQLPSDTSRNVGSLLTSNVYDYGRSTVKLTELERNTTSHQHILNINKSGSGNKMKYYDDAKTTVKETVVGLVDTNRNYRPLVINGDTNTGFTSWDPKSTQKESTIHNNYTRPITKNDGMGYVIANYDAKATIKQTTLNQNHLNHASYFVNDHMDYSASKDPQKVRYAVHAENYQGASVFFKSDSENRDRYYNANISDRKEQIVYKAPGQEFRGANSNMGKISAGEGLVGMTKSTDNMLFKERQNYRHADNVGNINNIIPNTTQLGNFTQQGFHNINSQIDVFNSTNLNSPNNRFNGNLITQQLSQNPFYNLK